MEDVGASIDGGRPPALPDDVHREIFFRLPARSLCRARAVCRSWLDVASEPSFLRAHAGRRAAAAPLLLTWSDAVTERDGTRDCTVHISIHQERGRGDGDRPAAADGDDDDGDDRGRRSRCCDLRLVLTARHPSISGGMRSWDGILCVEMWVRPQPPAAFAEHVPCSYLLLNPISRACTVASAPALRGSRSDRGYIAGAYSHPVTGVFHLLHSSRSAAVGRGEQTPRFRVLTVDAPDAAWREVPMSSDADTARLQTFAGRFRLQSSATAHGRLHWRVARARAQAKRRHETEDEEVEELLVFDAAREEFGRLALPRLPEARGVRQQAAISTVAGKLCLLAGVALTAVEVWVLEDYDARDWRRRHKVHLSPPNSPLHRDHCLHSVLGNVGVLVVGDELAAIIFFNCSRKVYTVFQPGSRHGSRPSGSFRHGPGIAVHEQSLLPHNVIFGTMPRVRGIAFTDCPNNGGQSLEDVWSYPRIIPDF